MKLLLVSQQKYIGAAYAFYYIDIIKNTFHGLISFLSARFNLCVCTAPSKFFALQPALPPPAHAQAQAHPHAHAQLLAQA
jgi:hypothetical protein